MNIVEKYAKANKIQSMGIDNLHKAKLYEMCNNIIDNNNSKCTVAVDGEKINIPIQGENRREYTHIHWFELCVTHLCFHVCSDPLTFMQQTIDYAMLVDKKDAKHPVDVLYEEYGKIKEMFKDVFNSHEAKENKDYFLEKV
jgi:hypothetical protein